MNSPPSPLCFAKRGAYVIKFCSDYEFCLLSFVFKMITAPAIPEPILFNPLKHHLGFIREYIYQKTEGSVDSQDEMIKELKHLGTSVMDVYTGSLFTGEVCNEVLSFLKKKELSDKEHFAAWTGTGLKDFRIISLSDGSQWTLKYHGNNLRFVHIFPARGSQHTLRVKSNTLKSALLYYILIGKDYITGDDLNSVRPLLGLSPIRDPADTRGITGMIEILRDEA
jgi:hypothetical protein